MSKTLMFMLFVWLIVSIAGGIYQGSMSFTATTTLTETIDDNDTTITVSDTTNFPDTGILVILDERIGYSSKTATEFEGSFAQPMIRGADDTDAVAHTAGERVRSVESSMLNSSVDYKLAILTDAAGVTAFVTIPLALISLLAEFFTLPMAFLGSGLDILTYIWALLSISVIASVAISLAGGRRV